jgi:hypothetical protein
MSMRSKPGVAALLAAGLFVAACGGTEDPASPETTSPEQTAEPSPEETTAAPQGNVVAIDAQEYAFVPAAEAQAQAGPLTLEFTNTGEELHHAIVGKLAEGKTLADVNKLLKKGLQGPPPPWFSDAPADMSLLSPGATAGVTIDAEEGTYVFLCFMESPDGAPHAMLGMTQAIEVSGSSDAATSADATISLGDDAVEAPELASGRSAVEVTNDASAPADFLVIQLEPGKTVEDMSSWDGTTPPPAIFFGGTHQIEPGASTVVTLDLEPGTYTVVSTVYEGKKPVDISTEMVVS